MSRVEEIIKKIVNEKLEALVNHRLAPIEQSQLTMEHDLLEMDKKVTTLFKLKASLPITNLTVEEKTLRLPDHLYTTYKALEGMGEGSAEMVSNATGKCRALESANLNELARAGAILRPLSRKGRIVIFKMKLKPVK